jgi:hypothetical protein
MIKKILLFSGAFFGLFLIPFSAKAVCPVCTIAIGAGVGLCRWLGIDDTVSGTWIGGLILSMSFWLLNWLDKKQIQFKFRKLYVVVLFYAITVIPLYFMGIIGHPYNKLWGIDKLVIGIIAGSIAFIASLFLEKLLRSKNNGKVFFPFQKVVLPVLFLTIVSVVFSFIC